jgi:ATP-dependent exoDNAse (exonuclease V) beta subunit
VTADAHQRQHALKLDQSWIIQAPAGSGKTELLTQRFLKLLGHVDRPERILAITFTRKATQEMRGRIMQRLQQAASGDLPDKEHEKLAVELARIALKQDQEQDWKLLRNPGRLRIHTIDGLCSQLLSRDPETGSHSADLQILEDAKPLYRLASQRVFEEFGAVPGHRADFGESGDALVRLLVHLDGNSQALTDLLVKMMGVRDQWIRRVGADVATIQAVLEDRQNRELDQFRRALSKQSLENAGRIIADLGRTMFDQDQPAAQFAAAFDHDDGTIQNHVIQAYWLSQVLTTGANIPRAVGGINRRLFPGLPDELTELPGALKDIYADWAADPSALTAIGRMARMPPLDMVAPQKKLLEDIRMVLRAAMIQLYAVFAENGQADFQYIADTALQVLGNEDQPGQVLLAEDMRLEHILMDEFQDTSHTQFELLRRLTAGWQCDDGRSLFLVGDPMQSIYRFREADVGQFIDIMQGAGLGQLMPRAMRLESNFRSDSEIVDWVNEHFERVFPSRHESDAGAVSYTRFEAEQGSGGIVGIHSLSDDRNDIDEAQIAVKLIRDVRHANDDPSIGVLGRTRRHLEVIAQELVRQGIDFEAVQIDKLASRPVVRDLMAITRALYHPADRVAWLSILRAPWCGLNVKQLHAVAGEDPDRNMLDLIALALEENILAGEVHERLARAYAILVNAVALRASRTLRERVEFTWLNLGGPYCYASGAELDNAEAFLSRLDEIERESGSARKPFCGQQTIKPAVDDHPQSKRPGVRRGDTPWSRQIQWQ